MFYQKRIFSLLALLCLLLSNRVQSQSITAQNGFTYTLAERSATSAGVYKKDGTLVRILWSGVTKDAGTYPLEWDGKDDLKQTVPNSSYDIKVVSNNLRFTWEGGVIGNTSTALTGGTKHRSYDATIGVAIAGGNLYTAAGYLEQTSNSAFNLNTPQIRFDPNWEYNSLGSNQNTDFVVTDGTKLYWAGYNAWQRNESFVFSTNVSSNALSKFIYGNFFKMSHGTVWYSGIDYHNTANSRPTGAAVSSRFLFISHKWLNYVSVVDKITGATVRKLFFDAPTALATDGDFLWVTSKTNLVQKFYVNGDGTLGGPHVTLSGLSNPVGMKVNGSVLAVVDAGTSQQVKAYNTGNGSLSWTLGQPGGYKTSPVVAPDRFGFWKRNDQGLQSFGGIDFEPDGSFWVTDVRTSRLQHFAADRSFIETVQHLPRNYTLSIDPNNHSRILNNDLEFEIDYSKPIAPNNGSWKLKYCWDRGDLTHDEDFSSMITLSNGRTYALERFDYTCEVVEFLPTGLRYTGVIVPIGDLAKLYDDGSIIAVKDNGVGRTMTWQKKTLTGFNGNNPVWGEWATIASTNQTTAQDPVHVGAYMNPWSITSTNIIPAFRGQRIVGERNVFHLGGLKQGTNQWLWRTSITTPLGEGDDHPFVDNGDFEVGGYGTNQGNQGNQVHTMERMIIYGYNGEFYKKGQANIFNWYWDNGLFLGRMGTTGTASEGRFAPPGMAGNAFAWNIIKEGNDYFIYHNDESWHSGVHRWRITGVSSIKEQTISLSGGTVTPPTPTLASNDLTNTLSASHPLGTSEILVSVNNSAYSAYQGQINVGNVIRPFGYWKFKVRAATGRNESAVVSSPEFTETQVVAQPSAQPTAQTSTLLVSPSLYATDVTTSSLVLNWNAVPNATSYALYGSIDGRNYGLIYQGSATYFNDDARPLDTYYYKVKAIANGYTESPLSEILSVRIPGTNTTTQVASKLATPTLSVSNLAPTSFLLSWNAIPNANSYVLYGSRDGSYFAIIYQGNSLSFLDDGSPSTTYYFRVKAVGTNIQESDFGTLTVRTPAYSSSRIMSTTNDSATAADLREVNTLQDHAGVLSPTEEEDFSAIEISRNTPRVPPTVEFVAVADTSAPANNYSVAEPGIRSGFNAEIRKVSVYPNPVTANNFRVSLHNYPGGNYTIRLRSISGSIIMSKLVGHTGRMNSYPISIETRLARGIYVVEVSGNNVFSTSRIIKN